MGNPSGAILQRDGNTYAVVTRIPAGIVTPEQLEKIAQVGRKFQIPLLKITSGQRIALVGLAKKDLPDVLKELGPLASPESAPCVRFVQACLGTETCQYGHQDSLGLAKEIDRMLSGIVFPAKVKIGVSGCPRSCGECHVRDIGILGSNRGWTVMFGGNAGTHPRFGDVIARDLSDSEVLDCVQRLSEYYRQNARRHERTARFMERTGMDTIKRDLLIFMPYIPIEKVEET